MLRLLLPWTRRARAERSYRRAVAELRYWQETERARMAPYSEAVKRIVEEGRSWR